MINNESVVLPAVGEKVLAVGLLGYDVMVEIVAHRKLPQYESPRAVVRVIEEGPFDEEGPLLNALYYWDNFKRVIEEGPFDEEGPLLNALYYWDNFKPAIEPSDIELEIMNTLFPHVRGLYSKLTDEEKQIVVKVIGLIDSNRAQLS